MRKSTDHDHAAAPGEDTDPDRVAAARALLDEADVLLVTGSSLSVYSGYRFVRQAAQADQPIGIVNIGAPRGRSLSAVHVDGRTGEVLPSLATTLIEASPHVRTTSTAVRA